jgi:hypothetical protein
MGVGWQRETVHGCAVQRPTPTPTTTDTTLRTFLKVSFIQQCLART